MNKSALFLDYSISDIWTSHTHNVTTLEIQKLSCTIFLHKQTLPVLYMLSLSYCYKYLTETAEISIGSPNRIYFINNEINLIYLVHLKKYIIKRIVFHCYTEKFILKLLTGTIMKYYFPFWLINQ